ncbi:MAG: glycosyltransferase family 39 protein [Anaerolineae bacterium]
MLGEAVPLSTARRADPWERRILLLLVLLAFGLSLWRIEAKSIWWDEGLSLHRAQQDVGYILSNRIRFPGADTTDQHPPLYFLVLHAFTRLAGESDLVLRLPSALSATFLVPLLYALGRKLCGRRVALLAALFGAVSPFYLWYAQEARPYAMVTALGLASVLLLWRVLTERRWQLALGWGLVTAAALATQYLFGLVVLFEVILALVYQLTVRRADVGAHWQRLPVVLAAVGMPLLALALLAPGLLQVAPSLASNRGYVPLPTILLDALNSFSLGLSVNLRDVWPLDALFGLALALGLVSLGRGAREETTRPLRLLLVAGYLFVPALAMWVVSFRLPVYMNSRYTIVSSPAFYLAVAAGVDALLRRRRFWGGIVLLALVAGMGFSSYRYYYHERYSTKQDYRSAAQLVAGSERMDDVVVLTGPENLAPFLHYYRGTAPVVALPSEGPVRGQVAADLQTLAESYDRIWLVQCPAPVTDPEDLVTQWLDASRLRMTRTSFESYGASVSVNTYLAGNVTVADPGSQALGTFGSGLEVVDCTLRHAGGDASWEAPWQMTGPEPAGTVPAGQAVSVVLTTRVREPLGMLKTSLRLMDASGQVWEQRDAEPIMSWSTAKWSAGETVRFEVDLLVPAGTPPGVFTLELLLYDVASMQPLPFRTAEGAEYPAMPLGQLRVERGAVELAQGELPDDLEPAGRRITFGGGVQLLGWRVGPDSVRAGERISLDLAWRALGARRGAYEVLLNWESAGGQIVGSGPFALAGVPYATSDWQHGELVWGKLSVPVPADLTPGAYRLHLLVRDTADGSYLWVGQGIIPWTGRNLPLGALTVSAP